jgi:hypothetical protein
VAKPDGINLNNGQTAVAYADRGAEATVRAVERAKREGSHRGRQPKPPVAREPFARSGEAMLELTAIMGYPPAVIPSLGAVTYRHKNFAREEDDEPSAPVPKKARATKEEIYRVVDGVQQRCCAMCKEWRPLETAYRRRKDHGHGTYSSECKLCEKSRRRDYYYRTRV